MRPRLIASLSFSLLAATGPALFAQPVITETDFFEIGDAATRHLNGGDLVDVTAFTQPGPAGAWDFAALISIDAPPIVLVETHLPTSAGGFGGEVHFPAAEVAVASTIVETGYTDWIFHSFTPAGRVRHGVYHGSLPPDEAYTDFVPATIDHPFPLTLGQTWTEDTSTAIFESSTVIHRDSTVDAWGTASLPGIGPVDCLRIHRLTRTEEYFDLGAGPVLLETNYFHGYWWVAEGLDVVAYVIDFPTPDLPGPAAFTETFVTSVLVEVGSAPQFLRGEVDGSGRFDLADPIRTVLHLFGVATLPCPASADFDASGVLDLGDVVQSLHYLFTGGAPPPPPFPACGAGHAATLPCSGPAPCP